MTLLLILGGSVFSPGQGNQSKDPRAAQDSRNIHGREKWFSQGRNGSHEPGAAARYRALRQKLAIRAARRARPELFLPDSALSGDWIPRGPAPVTSSASSSGLQDYNDVAGRATAVAIDPADNTGNTVYVGGAYGGVWKSENAGPLSTDPASVTWVPLTDNQETLAVGSIAIQPQPNNPRSAKSVILVGTGESNGSIDSYYGLGILRSANGGDTWTLITSDSSNRQFAGLGFGKIAFSSRNPNQVVAAASSTAQGLADGGDNPATATPGIYYSADAGVTWNYSTITDGGTTIDPASVSDVAYNDGAQLFFAAVALHGIYESPDGIRWTRLAQQPGAFSAASCPSRAASLSCPLFRGQLAGVPGRNEMYAWYVDARDNDGGIWSSVDGGNSWVQIDDSGITFCGDLFGGCGTAQGSYNLALTAVPSGTATELYAGAVNLYKCSVTSLPLKCAGFINLTHVYGCSAIARMHPAQHAIASLLINKDGQDVMYFGNDGGVYRTLNGYTDLTSGSCGTSNSFQSLNGTLGSMTQLISFSQSSIPQTPNPNVLLAGAQANGSPGTASLNSGTGWQNVNAGDGSYTAISPTDDQMWFVSNPADSVSGVKIFKCGKGVACRSEDFQNNQVVSGPDLGGDAGGFNTPYILDPQNPAGMIVGTCRVWRGPSSGGTFTNLSNNFETGGDGICSGTETNVVRSLAAGGSLDQNNFSNVIYAGTDGSGPLASGLPVGGRVWVNTNVSGTPSIWNDQTGTINPQHFPVSAIAVDTSDPTGKTAYVGIMGFALTHVRKTTSGGISWTDFNAGLPPAPVNALLIDGGIVYAGTDVGVFARDSSATGWSEVGPPPTANTPGFLPNVAVTGLGILDVGGDRTLRVSTYGRGLWELSTFSLSPPLPGAVSVVVPAVSDPVRMSVSSSLDGMVSFSCTGLPAGAKCDFFSGNPVHISPHTPIPVMMDISTMPTTPCSVSQVAIHAFLGSATQTQNLALTVTGNACFSIVNTSGAKTVNAGEAAVYNLQVTPSSPTFLNSVSFTCSGLPTLATCSFSPAQISSGSAATTVVLTIATSAATSLGTQMVTVTGVSDVNATATLSLTVQNNVSFSLANIGPPIIAAGSSGIYDITLTPSASGLLDPVTLSYTSCPVTVACSFDNTVVAAGSGVTHRFLTVTTSAATPAGTYTITVTGSSNLQAASTIISFSVSGTVGAFSFTLSNTGPATISIGKSATFDIVAMPSFGTFPNPVALTFTGCPAVSTCLLSSTQIAPGNGTTHVSFTIATTPPAVSTLSKLAGYALMLPLSGLMLLIGGFGESPRKLHLRILLMIVAAAICSGCGGLQGGSAAPAANPGTLAGVYTVTVIGTSGSISANTTISVTVQVGSQGTRASLLQN